MCIYIYIYQEGIRNRTEPAEPNRTEPFNSGTGRNRTRNRTEANRTEPRRVRKTQAEPRRTGENTFPNRTEPNRLVWSGTETNRTEPCPSWYYYYDNNNNNYYHCYHHYHYHTDKTHMDGARVHVLEREWLHRGESSSGCEYAMRPFSRTAYLLDDKQFTFLGITCVIFWLELKHGNWVAMYDHVCLGMQPYDWQYMLHLTVAKAIRVACPSTWHSCIHSDVVRCTASQQTCKHTRKHTL